MSRLISWLTDRLSEHSTQLAIALAAQVAGTAWPDYSNYANAVSVFFAGIVAVRKG